MAVCKSPKRARCYATTLEDGPTIPMTLTRYREKRTDESGFFDTGPLVRVMRITWKDLRSLDAAQLGYCVSTARLAAAGYGSKMAVHCRAGQGRTGTFLAARQVQCERDGGINCLSPLGHAALALLWTRKQREHAVETPEQFAPIVEATQIYDRNEER